MADVERSSYQSCTGCCEIRLLNRPIDTWQSESDEVHAGRAVVHQRGNRLQEGYLLSRASQLESIPVAAKLYLHPGDRK